jgi:hypothetical protein
MQISLVAILYTELLTHKLEKNIFHLMEEAGPLTELNSKNCWSMEELNSE